MFSWENKNVLITGATGFVGSHLYARLKKLGAKTYGISKTYQKGNIYKLNVVNYSSLNDLIEAKKINICFHLAGEALVESGQGKPYQTFKTNLDGALNILESARVNNLEKVIIASSAHVYGKNKVPYMEEDVPRPSRPYETSKACTDLIAQSYADSFSLPVLIPRFVNIYGPGDTNFKRLIPKTIKSVLEGKDPEMWGGSAVRDYLYIDDAVDAYVKLGELDQHLMESNRTYNFGTGEVISVKELIQKIIKLSGSDLSIKRLEEERVDEITKQYLSSEKAGRILSWKPRTRLASGLSKTLDWYSEYFNKKNDKR